WIAMPRCSEWVAERCWSSIDFENGISSRPKDAAPLFYAAWKSGAFVHTDRCLVFVAMTVLGLLNVDSLVPRFRLGTPCSRGSASSRHQSQAEPGGQRVPRQSLGTRKGSVLLEFALIAIVVFFLLAVIMDFGRATFAAQSIEQA